MLTQREPRRLDVGGVGADEYFELARFGFPDATDGVESEIRGAEGEGDGAGLAGA